MSKPIETEMHPFERAPHRTLLALSLPILLSLIAEPLTGLVDTGFVARLGAVPLAALGVGTAGLTSLFWVFNFLGIGSQTAVAQALGRGDVKEARQISSLAISMGIGFGLLLVVTVWLAAPWVGMALGAEGEVLTLAVTYMRWRLLGAPAVLVSLVAFGVLRGLQDMRTPSYIAVAINVLNVLLDPILIFGWAVFPALGVGGAALASAISQWLGALWAWRVVYGRVGWSSDLHWQEARALLRVGGDLFLRTGLLMGYLLLATRSATRMGVASGAAHQAIRQLWIFSALVLEAFATTAQSLVGYFYGSGRLAEARRVAKVAMGWSVGVGVVLAAGMWLGRWGLAAWLVPVTAVGVFMPAWFVAAITQPLNALAFITDGIHWGTGDYRFLRNGMLAATLTGGLGLIWLDEGMGANGLVWVWCITAVWIAVRAVFGVGRIWRGGKSSPLGGSGSE